jgi:AraC-like DNA-binding protein
VRRQRLLKCRDAVARATGATGGGRSVADIAFGNGFNSMATFYRAFADEFGAAPTALRAAVGTAVERFEEKSFGDAGSGRGAVLRTAVRP